MLNKDSIIRQLQSNKPLLSSFGIRSVGLFGSCVRDEQSENSDIDILVDFYTEKENFDNLMAVCDLCENLFKGQKVEVVTTTGLSPYIGPAILKEVQYV